MITFVIGALAAIGALFVLYWIVQIIIAIIVVARWK